MTATVSERIGRIVHTELGRIGPHSAGVRITISGVSHRLEVATANGKFTSALVEQVNVALVMWFDCVMSGLTPEQRDFFQTTVVNIIRERHQQQLPRVDPRRLPLTLPAFGPSTSAGTRMNRAQREKAAAAKG